MNNTFYPLKIESGGRSISASVGFIFKIRNHVCYCLCVRCQMSYCNKSLSQYSDFHPRTLFGIENYSKLSHEVFLRKTLGQKNIFPNINRICQDVLYYVYYVVLVNVEFNHSMYLLWLMTDMLFDWIFFFSFEIKMRMIHNIYAIQTRKNKVFMHFIARCCDSVVPRAAELKSWVKFDKNLSSSHLLYT